MPLRVVDLMIDQLTKKKCPRHTRCPNRTHIRTTCTIESNANCAPCEPSIIGALDYLRTALLMKVVKQKATPTKPKAKKPRRRKTAG